MTIIYKNIINLNQRNIIYNELIKIGINPDNAKKIVYGVYGDEYIILVGSKNGI
jgi:hypothetical protein